MYLLAFARIYTRGVPSSCSRVIKEQVHTYFLPLINHPLPHCALGSSSFKHCSWLHCFRADILRNSVFLFVTADCPLYIVPASGSSVQYLAKRDSRCRFESST